MTLARQCNSQHNSCCSAACRAEIDNTQAAQNCSVLAVALIHVVSVLQQLLSWLVYHEYLDFTLTPGPTPLQSASPHPQHGQHSTPPPPPPFPPTAPFGPLSGRCSFLAGHVTAAFEDLYRSQLLRMVTLGCTTHHLSRSIHHIHAFMQLYFCCYLHLASSVLSCLSKLQPDHPGF